MKKKKVLNPVNSSVLLKFYDENPYNKEVEKTEGGLILATEGAKKYKSHETGEMEENEEYVACAKVIAVGPECKNVKVGEDVFCYKRFAIPMPYMKMGYYTLAEQNINCRVSDVEEYEADESFAEGLLKRDKKYQEFKQKQNE